MRKGFFIIITFLLGVAIIGAVSATPTVILDDQQRLSDVQLKIEDGRTLVPLRAIFESMGYKVTWDQEALTATAIKDRTIVKLQIGSTTPTINGKVTTLDVPAKIINGRTMVPLKFVGESFGGIVGWDATTQTISFISTDGNIIIPISPDENDLQVFKENLGKNILKNTPPLKPNPSDTSNWVAISDICLKKEVVTIKNNNAMWSADMTGWYLVSEKANQIYHFPDNFRLAAGDTIYITSGQGAIDQYPSYLKWTESCIWDDKGDSGRLYNSSRQLVAQWP